MQVINQYHPDVCTSSILFHSIWFVCSKTRLQGKRTHPISRDVFRDRFCNKSRNLGWMDTCHVEPRIQWNLSSRDTSISKTLFSKCDGQTDGGRFNISRPRPSARWEIIISLHNNIVPSSPVPYHGEDRTRLWEIVPWSQDVLSSECPIMEDFIVLSPWYWGGPWTQVPLYSETSDQGTPQQKCPHIWGVPSTEGHLHVKCKIRHKKVFPWKEVSPDQRVPWKEVSPDQRVPWKEVSPDQRVPWKEVSPDQRVPWKEVSPDQRVPWKEVSPDQRVPWKEVSPDQRVPWKEVSPDQRVPWREVSPDQRVPEKRFHLIRGSPEERCPLKRGFTWSEGPWKEISPDQRVPEKRFHLIRGSPEKRFHLIRGSPEKRFHLIRGSPEERCPLIRGSPEDRFHWIWINHKTIQIF